MADDSALVEAVATAVAGTLGFPTATPSERVARAAAAATMVARRYIYPGADPQPDFPDPDAGPDLFAGLVALGVRIYHDPASPGGVVGGDAYTGAAIPEDLLAHVRHYFDPYRTRAWGIA